MNYIFFDCSNAPASARNSAHSQKVATLVKMLASSFWSGNKSDANFHSLIHCYHLLCQLGSMRKARTGMSEAEMPLFQAATNDAQIYQKTDASRIPSYLRDHRKRLRERFMASGSLGCADYELLELILFRAIPRQDVKPLARRMLEAFGDLNAVIAAPVARLRMISGVGDSIILELKLIEACAQRMARARIMDRPVLSSWQALLDYCHTAMSHRETEQFRVLFLDRKNVLIADEAQGEGTVDHVPVYPREVLRRALELNASALILVHNHPSGDPSPSQADISMTETIRAAGEALSITLHDHIIIGKSRELSFRSEGYL